MSRWKQALLAVNNMNVGVGIRATLPAVTLEPDFVTAQLLLLAAISGTKGVGPVAENQPHDELLEALDALLVVLRESTKRNQLAIRQATAIQRLHASGRTYREIFDLDERSLIRQVTRDNVDEMIQASARLRWAEARALHAEGMTMDKIAVLFGLTRQRISTLLKEKGDLRAEWRWSVGNRPAKGASTAK